MKTVTLWSRAWWRALPLLAALVLLGSIPAWAGPGRPDPRQMSGIPRPDPQIPAGEITVRVLRGSFDEPALDAMVELELRSADGRVAELRQAEAGNQGRAYFRDLGDFTGGQAVARVVLDGETIRSQQIDVRADSGTAVMLVKGAVGRGPSQEISLPGIVFDFDKTPAGSLMVGVFDLQSRKGLVGTEIQLEVTTPDGSTETRTVTTEKMGQATFEGMGQLPEGAVVQVVAKLDEEGEPYRSMRFVPDPSKGQAVVLARGRMGSAGGSPHDGGAASPKAGGDPHSPKLTKLPPPQVKRALRVGTVQLLLVDGKDQPIADYPITIVKKDFAGTETKYEAKTNSQGVATQADLPVVNDALYYVGVSFDGAPYTSSFFGLDKRGGVSVAMRVWPVTPDRTVARSAIQFEVIEGEDDTAQVIQVYEVLVSGDKAFWPGAEPLVIEGLPGAKHFTVLRGAEDWLNHEEKAPFATLAHPIPPGEVAPLSVGYVMDGHDGTLEIDWTPPFQVIESALVASDALELDAPGAKISDRESPQRPGLDYTPVIYELGQQGTGPVHATLNGLRETNKIYEQLGMLFAALIGGVVFAVVLVSPRRSARERLGKQRDELLAALPKVRSAAERDRMVAALDRLYRKIEALDAITRAGRQSRPPTVRSGDRPKAS